MKKIIGFVVLLCICTAGLHAQTCSPAGFDQFYPLKTSMRVGLFTPPNDHIDSIGCYAVAFGLQTKPKGYGSMAINYSTVTTGDYSFAAGAYSTASGLNSLAAGYNTLASGYHSASFGYNAWATGNTSFVAGYATKATNNYATAFGQQSEANGLISMATGWDTRANGNYSFSGGNASLALGDAAFAFGQGARAASPYSFAIGYLTEANGSGSFAGGNSAKANGNISLAFGTNALAGSGSSVAIGESTNTSGLNAITLGYYSKASGNYSVSLGSYADARATETIAAGKGIITKAYMGVAIGCYNDSSDAPNPLVMGSTDRIFQVGAGSTPSVRYNAMTVLRNGNIGIGALNPTERLEVTGNIKASGTLTVQNKGIIRSVDGTQQKKLVANVIVSGSFTAGQTRTFTVTWPESFSAAPDGFVGSLVSGTGGWAEVVMTLGTASTTGVTLYVYNPRTVTANPNFTVKIIAIGAQ